MRPHEILSRLADTAAGYALRRHAYNVAHARVFGIIEDDPKEDPMYFGGGRLAGPPLLDAELRGKLCSKAGCGAPAARVWSACADGNAQRPLCLGHDLALNVLALAWFGDPDRRNKIEEYREELSAGADREVSLGDLADWAVTTPDGWVCARCNGKLAPTGGNLWIHRCDRKYKIEWDKPTAKLEDGAGIYIDPDSVIEIDIEAGTVSGPGVKVGKFPSVVEMWNRDGVRTFPPDVEPC